MKRALIVDDQPEILDLGRAILEAAGWEVDTARHGAEALAKARLTPPSVLVTDLLMPVMDGYVLLQQWKADPRLASIPVVVQTGTYSDQSHEQLARDLGADAFITKPTKPADLVARLDGLLDPVARAATPAARPRTTTEPPDPSAYSEVLARKLDDKLAQLDRLNASLASGEARLRTAVAAANVGLWDWDLATNDVWYSPEWKRQIGYGDDELSNDFEEWRSRVHPDDLDTAMARVRAFLADPWPNYANEFRFRHRDGSYRDILVQASLLRDAAGRPLRMIGSHLDITSRKRSEEAQRAQEASYRLLFDANPHPMWVYDLATLRFLAVNDAALAQYGYSREEMLAMTIADIRPAADLPRLLENVRAVQPDGLDRAGTWRHRRRDGSEIEVEITSHELVFDGRHSELVLAVDVTEQRRAERQVHSLNRTYAVLSAINELIVRERDRERLLTGACRIAVERGGFAMAWVGLTDTTGNGLRNAAHAGATPETLAIIDEICGADGVGCAFTARALATGRHAVCADVATDPLANSWRAPALARGYRAMVSLPLVHDGRCTGTFNLYAAGTGVFDDAELRLLDELAADLAFALAAIEREADRQRAAAELQASEERFRELAETIDDVFWTTDATKEAVLYVSPAYERIWGQPCQSVYERPSAWLDAVHPQDRERIARAAATQQVLGRYDEEYRILRPDGELRWIRERAYPVRDREGRVVRVLGVARDITRRRELSEQLRVAQKLEAVGRLAGGVAHDFNNLLGVMLLHVELLRPLAHDPGRVTNGLAQIQAAIDRAAALTRQLLTFSRRQVMQTQDLDLNAQVTALVKLLRPLLGEDVRLDVVLEPTPLLVHADPGMIDQVLMNLAVNARDAMPRGGLLHIETSAIGLDETAARRSSDAVAGRYVRLRVRDTGEGMSAAVQSHVFEPFFTTKEPGRGTGLGLATSFGIVRQHAGWIEVASAPGEGATFDVYLPAASTPAAPSTETPTAPLGGRETILLVEDEPTLRRATREVLETAGYRVLEAVDAASATDAWRQREQPIHLLFTDFALPGGTNGIELAARLGAEDPSLRVLLTSGYSSSLAGRQLVLPPGQAFLPKPASSPDLLRAVRTALEASR